MLDEHGTPRKYWAEAISIACRMTNRVFLRSSLAGLHMSYVLDTILVCFTLECLGASALL